MALIWDVGEVARRLGEALLARFEEGLRKAGLPGCLLFRGNAGRSAIQHPCRLLGYDCQTPDSVLNYRRARLQRIVNVHRT